MLEFYNDITFANKEFLWLLFIVPFIFVWYFLNFNNLHPSLKTSSLINFKDIEPTYKERLLHLPIVLRMFSVALLIFVLARPQSSSSWKDVKSQGIDIVITLDISSSMLSKDFKPNRLESAKAMAQEFINNRPFDRIGLVVFSGESFTQCPLTSDHTVVKNLFSGINVGIIKDGTAVGEGLAMSVSRIKDSEAKSKVIILMTDGVNNAGSISPITAAEIAKTFNVRVYTIGVGKKGQAMSPVGMYPDGKYEYAMREVNIDEESLAEMADMTGGKYFRATNKEKLKDVYKEIDRLEKTIFEEKNFTNKSEMFFPFAIIAALLLLLEFLLKNTILKTTP